MAGSLKTVASILATCNETGSSGNKNVDRKMGAIRQ
jgi:hypothetical protein